jgi:hydrogenase small subunit
MFDTVEETPKKDILAGLAARAGDLVAVGTCAAFGGISANCSVEACGLQYDKEVPGGFLGTGFTSGNGRPVINLPGCPVHPDIVKCVLATLAAGGPCKLNSLNAPHDWYNMLVHQGCTRNEYHEYRVEDSDFGERGCMFFHMGCRAPLAHGPCNKVLWNSRNSKTRSGVPCFGCTQPEFPQDEPFFQTSNIEGIPLALPEGVDRAHYMAYKGMAAAAAPDRLKKRETGV